MKMVVITGASSGLGKIIGRHFFYHKEENFDVCNWSIENGVDVRDKNSIMNVGLKVAPETVDILINCAGVNGINPIPQVEEAEWDKIMNTNVKGMFLTTQALLSRLRGGTIVNIISNASRIPMTHSSAYNASKGAAEILTRQMARELGKSHDITVFGVSPNKLKGTGMSRYIEQQVCDLRGWTPEEAAKYQLDALPAGEETDPNTLAEFIAFLLSTKERHKYLQGCIIPYGGP